MAEEADARGGEDVCRQQNQCVRDVHPPPAVSLESLNRERDMRYV